MISLIRTAARAASMNDASPPLHDDADGKGEEEEVVVDEKEDMAISAVEQRRILLPRRTRQHRRASGVQARAGPCTSRREAAADLD